MPPECFITLSDRSLFQVLKRGLSLQTPVHARLLHYSLLLLETNAGSFLSIKLLIMSYVMINAPSDASRPNIECKSLMVECKK